MRVKSKKKPYLLRHKDYLSLLTKSKKDCKRCKHLIAAANSGEVAALSEACMNILQGNVPDNHLTKLRKYRNKIRKVASKSTSVRAKKKSLQEGGFLSVLLPIIASAASGLIGGLTGG